jgi:hypothetical protein
VHLTIHFPPLSESLAAELLGSEHPLARAFDRRSALRLELTVAGVLLTAAVVAVAEGARGAAAVALGAVVAVAVAGVRMLLTLTAIRSLVLELLVAGRGSVPLREVQAERSRLLDVRRRQREAEWLVRVADGRDLGLPAAGGGPALISARVAKGARDELLAVAAVLRDDTSAVQGLALAEQIARESWSPLYGQDTRALREACSRARYLSAARGGVRYAGRR